MDVTRPLLMLPLVTAVVAVMVVAAIDAAVLVTTRGVETPILAWQ